MLIVAISLASMAFILFSSCGDDSSPTDTKSSAHKVTAEDRDRIIAETIEDLNIISSIETDTAVLATAMSGQALEEMKAGIVKELAEGKVKKRDYQNISATFEQLNYPVAQVLVEFDDFSYYVDAKTGAALSEPTGEHMRYAMAVVEEDGLWKIQGIFAPSSAETPRVLPTDTGTTTGATP